MISVFLFSVLATTFKNGFYIDKLTFEFLKVDTLYIKLDDKFIIYAKEIKVTTGNTNSTTPNIDIEKIKTYLKLLKFSSKTFESIVFDDIKIDDLKISFKYKPSSESFLKIENKDIFYDAKINIGNKYIKVDVLDAHIKGKELKVHTNTIIDIENMNLYIKSNINFYDEIVGTLYSNISTDKIQAIADINKTDSITKFIDSLELPKAVTPWITKYAKFSHITPSIAYINYDYKKPILESIYAKATGYNVAYKFEQNTGPAKSKKVDLEFKNGFLNINLNNVSFYKHKSSKTKLDIDFRTSFPMLHLNLDLVSRVDQDVLNLLKQYKIELPLIQKAGKSDVKLKLNIDLYDGNISAKGDFKVSKSLVNFAGVDINVKSSQISLNDADVKIKSLHANYDKKVGFDLTGNLDISNFIGNFDGKINFVDFNIDDKRISLAQKGLNVSYDFNNSSETLSVAKSHWLFDNHDINIEDFIVPTNMKKLTANFNPLLISVDDSLYTYFSGPLSLNDKTSSIDLDIVELNYKGISLDQTSLPVNISTLGSRIKIKTDQKSHWELNDIKLEIEPSKIFVNKNYLNIVPTNINVSDVVTAKVTTTYNIAKGKGKIKLNDLNIKDKRLGSILTDPQDVVLDLTSRKNSFRVYDKKHKIAFTQKDNGWKFTLNSLKRISTNSKLLRDFNLTKGNFEITSKDGSMPFLLKASIYYPYPILVGKNNVKRKKYKVLGKINKKDVLLDIQKKIKVKLADNISIKVKDSSIDILSLIQFIKDRPKNSDTKKKDSLNIKISAKNSNLYLSDNKSILFDKANGEYKDETLNFLLLHNHGKARLKIKDNNLSVSGKNFDDKFMNALSKTSIQRGGQLSFSFKGPLDNINGLVKVKDTTILDFTLINNILAFLNTIPSLVTFSLPHYSTEGLYIKSAYSQVNYKGSKVTLKDIYVDSDEIDVVGSGNLNMDTEKINIKLNLKTDIGSKLSKVPIVGYVIFGEEGSITTALKITGNMENPKVSTAIAKEIIVAPFNMILRTLSLPIKVFE